MKATHTDTARMIERILDGISLAEAMGADVHRPDGSIDFGAVDQIVHLRTWVRADQDDNDLRLFQLVMACLRHEFDR